MRRFMPTMAPSGGAYKLPIFSPPTMRALRELRAAGGNPPPTSESHRSGGSVHPEYARHGELSSLLYPEKAIGSSRPPSHAGFEDERYGPSNLMIGATSDCGRRPVLTPYAAAAIAAARERRAAAPVDARASESDFGDGPHRRPHPEHDPAASVLGGLLYPERASRPATQQQQPPPPPMGRRGHGHDEPRPPRERRQPEPGVWNTGAPSAAAPPPPAASAGVAHEAERRHSHETERLRREREERHSIFPLARGLEPQGSATAAGASSAGAPGPRYREYVIEHPDADAEPLLRQPRTHERGVVGKVGALATVFDDGRIFEGIPEGGARHAPRGHEAATPHELGSLRAQVAALTHLLHQGVVVPLPSLAGGGACSAGDGHSMHVWFGPAMVGVGGANAETAAGEPRWQWKLVPLCR